MLKKKIIDGYQPINQLRGTGQVKDVLFWVLSPSLCRKGKQQKHLKHVGDRQIQIYLPGHWWPNSVVMFLWNKLTYIYYSCSTTWNQSSITKTHPLRRHFEGPVEAVFMCAGFTHRLLWWVRQTSFWPDEFWDCVAWERQQKWFRYDFQQDKRKKAILVLKLVPGLLTGTPLLLSHSGLLWVDDCGSSHHDGPIFTWHRLMESPR